MQHRQQRVGDQIRAELSKLILQELKDPRLGFVTLTEVRMSGDLKIAKVYVSVYGTEEEEEESLEALRHAVGFLRREIGRRLPLRYTPELRFEADRTIRRASRLEALFAEMGDESDDDPETGDDDRGADQDGEGPDG